MSSITSPTSTCIPLLPTTPTTSKDAVDVSIRAAKRRKLYGLGRLSTSSPSRPSPGSSAVRNLEQADPSFSLDEDSGTERRGGDGAGHLNIGRLESEDRESDAANDDSERDDSDQEEQDILQLLLSDIVHEYYANTGMSDEQRSALIAQATAASKMPRAVWNKLQTLPDHSFASGTFPSDYLLKKALSDEAKLDMKFIDCCINGCRAYTRSYENDTVCYSCLEPRYASDGRPGQKFTYLSPINRLRSQHGNKDICARLRYPFVRTVDKGKYQDIWEGAHIKRLRKKKVEWAGQQVDGAGFYFEDDTHIALGLAMDGLPCFKRSKLDCWPILLTNYSLAPEVRAKREFQMCCGLIPGTRDQTLDRKVDMDSFLWPLIEDLKTMATTGVPAKRWTDNKLINFTMRAHCKEPT